MDKYLDIAHLDAIGIMQCLLSKSAREFESTCIQKFNWNVDDFNRTMAIEAKEVKDIVYLIVLADWILECSDALHSIYKKYESGFSYCDSSKLSNCRVRFRAIRSFVVAHPLNTDRHSDFGYDGSKKAIDIWMSPLVGAECDISKGTDFYVAWCKESDICYSFEGHSFSEIYECVEVIVDELNCFMTYLKKIRKRDLPKF